MCTAVETGLRRFVSCDVKLQLHEPGDFNSDMEESKVPGLGVEQESVIV